MSALPPLLLIPSLLCTAALWQNQVNHLKDIADCAVQDTTRHDRLADLARAILHTAPPQFALAGLSMGGYVALEIVRQAPERVLKLAIFNSSARADTPEQHDQRRISIAASRTGQFKGVTPRLLPTLIHPDRIHDATLTGLIMDMALEMGREVFVKQQTAIMHRIDSRPFLKDIPCPTLAVGGAQDQVTPPELMREIAAAVPRGRCEILDHCGHLSVLEQPQRVNALMRDWLRA